MRLYFEDSYTAKRAEFLAELVQFAARELLGTKLPNIVIEFESFPTKREHALCEWLDREQLPREFKISISAKLNPAELALAVFHEMVHVKQMYKGELKYRGPRSFWKKEEYDGQTRYHDLPWEIEAYKLQEEIGWKYLAKREKEEK